MENFCIALISVCTYAQHSESCKSISSHKKKKKKKKKLQGRVHMAGIVITYRDYCFFTTAIRCFCFLLPYHRVLVACNSVKEILWKLFSFLSGLHEKINLFSVEFPALALSGNFF